MMFRPLWRDRHSRGEYLSLVRHFAAARETCLAPDKNLSRPK